MAYVPVPKDLTKVKTKVMFNLTKRQLICFGGGALIGVPLFFLLKNPVGTSAASMCMVVVMLPFFLLALYEKNGQPLEKIIGNIIQVAFVKAKNRPYRTNNFYAVLERQDQLDKEVYSIVHLWKKANSLNWPYIRQETEKLGIGAFEESCRTLSEKLFCPQACSGEAELNETEQAFLAEFTSSGTYGTRKNRVKKKLHTMQPDEAPIRWQTKAKYLLERLFPGREWFRQFYPFCDRYPVIIPFFCVFRVFRALFQRGSVILSELRSVRETK